MDASNTSRRLCTIALANLEPASTPLPRPAKRRSLRLSKILLLLLSAFAPAADGAILQPTTTNLRLKSNLKLGPVARASSTSILVRAGQTKERMTVRVSAPGSMPMAPVVVPEPKSPRGQPYYFDERMHSFGNIGPGGRFHAFFAPLATLIIDKLSYDGVDARALVHSQLPQDGSVLDLCCGVGFSTPRGGTGVDTSPAFLDMARLLQPNRTFVRGNAETFGATFSYDVVTVLFATHEMPRAARRRVLANAARVARKSVVVVDIDPEFKLALTQDPSRATQAKAFLAGEPYVFDYLRHVDSDITACARSRGWLSSSRALIPGHVRMWTLTRTSPLENGGRASTEAVKRGNEHLYPGPTLDWGV